MLLFLLLLQLSGTFGQCTNACIGSPNWAFDGDCDDGGLGAEFAGCQYGTDCYDCGPRSQSSPPPPTAGTSSSTGATASLHAVSIINGITYYSGAGSSWTVPQHSPLVSFAWSSIRQLGSGRSKMSRDIFAGMIMISSMMMWISTLIVFMCLRRCLLRLLLCLQWLRC